MKTFIGILILIFSGFITIFCSTFMLVGLNMHPLWSIAFVLIVAALTKAMADRWWK
jgi:hypothetical protein